MQSRLRYLSILFLVLLSTAATAQVYTRRLASGNTSDFNKAGAAGLTGPVARRSVNPVDTRLFAAEDEQRTKLGLPDRLGVDIEMLTDFMQVAGKTVDNNQQISRFRFDVPTAQGLSVMFDSLFLANGAQLFIYNADQTVLIGPVTGQQNGRNFWSDLVTGESLIIELKEPLAVAGQSIVTVAKLIQFYRFVPKFGFNTSSSCEINTACYPAYQNEADGVAMLLTNYSPYTYACTGSMLNTTQQNFRSFLLTAFHCFDFSGDGTLQTAERNAAASTQIRFHWESPVCTPTATDNVYLSITGSTLRAAYVNSDFSLLELNQQVPPSENITYLGWDRNNSNFSSVFGIHHPSADIKKISFSNNATTFIGTVMTAGGNYYTTPGSTHLNVTWNASPNTLGVTEGGSSGSALFNPDRRVVGQLHGGGSYCTSPTSPDQYGRLYTSWTGGGSSATRLSDWLNPAGSAATTTNSVKSQVSGPVTFVSAATFSFNAGSSAITSWVVTGGNGMISPVSGSGNVASLTATGSVSGATITFSINAGQSYPISFTKSFNADAGENFPPSAANIPAQSATVGTPFSYTVPAFTDPEGLPLTYSAAGLPNGLSFNPATRVINGTPTTSGTFVASITGTDQGSLAASVAFLFTVNCPVTSINAGSVAVCQGQSVNLSASGAATYLWSTGANTAAINPAPAQTTTYSVTGTTNSCIAVAIVTIQVQSLPSVSITAGATTICQGQLVNLTASGAATYLWSTGANTTGITPAPAQTTTYSVTGTTNGCSSVTTVTVSVQARPSLAINAGATSLCQGQSVNLTATGAASYLWSTGANTASINPAPAQTTTFSVTGTTNGCSSVTTLSVSVQARPSLAINAGATSLCQGQSALLTATGAASYLWSTGANTASINTVPAQTTTYSVTGTTNGCSSVTTLSVSVQARPSLAINAGATSLCQGQTISLTATGAASYLWSTGANTASINPAPAQTTTYSVTGTTNGCSSVTTLSVSVQARPSLAINAGATSLCQGQTISLIATGAASYLWSTGANTASINPAPAQTTTYSVTGTTNGCSSVTTLSVSVQARPSLAINAGATSLCQGQTISLTATGAASYLWSTGANTASINTVPAQTTTYSVTGTTNGCSSVTTLSVSVLAPPSLSVTIEALTICRGGSVDLRASGANTYLWSTGANTAGITITPDQTGLYSVTGTTNGCSAIRSVSVLVDDIPLPSASISDRPCEGQPVSITLSGGYTYIWSTGDRGPVLTVTPSVSSVYSATVLSKYGCSSQMTIMAGIVKPNPTLSITSGSASICQGQSISLSAAGATSYVWSTGETRAGIQPGPIQTTTYSVTGTTDGCSSTTTVTVPVRERPVLSVNVSSASTCQGQPVSLTASGADAYIWSTSERSARIQSAPLQTTTYSVTGITNGCSSVTAITVTVQSLPSLSVSASSLTICRGQSVSLTAAGAGSYAWSTGGSVADIESAPIQTTTYSVTGTSNGCSATASVSVFVDALPLPTAIVGPIPCEGYPLSISVAGGYTYIWSNGDRGPVLTVIPTINSHYSVTAVSQSGCTSQLDFPGRLVRPNPAVSITAASFSACPGQSVSLTAGGADAYVWSTGETRADILPAPTQTTTYSVTGTTNGCSSATTVTIAVQPCPLSLSAMVTNCQAGELSLRFIATGGIGTPYEYAGIGVTPWTTRAGIFTIPVFSDTAPLELWVRNAGTPENIVRYSLPIPACARPLPVTVTLPQTETAAQPLQISGASINCSSRIITLSTTGGNNAPVYQRILFVTNFQPVAQPLLLDYDIFAERKPVQLQVQQSGVNSALFTFDYSSQCQSVTATPPATQTAGIPQQSCASPAATLGQPLALSASLTCQGSNGVLSFFPRGGQLQANTVFEFMSPGITGWTTSCTVSVTEADPVLVTFVRQRNPATGDILAQTSYTLPNTCASGGGRTALADDSFPVTILGNPTSARHVTVAIAGRAGQPLWLTVTDVQGRIISNRRIDATPWPVPYQVELGPAAGVYLLTIRSIQKRQTFSIIRY